MSGFKKHTENKKAGKGSPQMSIEAEAMDGLMKVMRRVIATPPQPRKAKPKPKPKKLKSE